MTWKTRAIDEKIRIREEEKRQRFLIIKEKKDKLRTGEWKKKEIEKLTSTTTKRLDLAEAKHNLWT